MSWVLHLHISRGTVNLTCDWVFLTKISHFKAFLINSWNSSKDVMKTERSNSPWAKKAKTKNWKGACAGENKKGMRRKRENESRTKMNEKVGKRQM